MKRIRHYILGLIALSLLPLFWIMLNVVGARITPLEFFNEWRTQLNSNEPWGGFDGG